MTCISRPDQRGWREDGHNAFTQHSAPGRPAGPSSQFPVPAFSSLAGSTGVTGRNKQWNQPSAPGEPQ